MPAPLSPDAVKELAASKQLSFEAEAAAHSLNHVGWAAQRSQQQLVGWILECDSLGWPTSTIARIAGLHRSRVRRIINRNQLPLEPATTP